jgi:hypothetical protein
VDHDDGETEGGVSDKFWMERYVKEMGSEGPSLWRIWAIRCNKRHK